jgi:hypothetical protein
VGLVFWGGGLSLPFILAISVSGLLKFAGSFLLWLVGYKFILDVFSRPPVVGLGAVPKFRPGFLKGFTFYPTRTRAPLYPGITRF